MDARPTSSIIFGNPYSVKTYVMDDIIRPVDTTTSSITPINQSLNLREALNGVDDLIVKLKSKKKSIPLS